MNEQETSFTSSALQVNLERTAAKVEIPDRYSTLLRVAGEHYGVLKRTTELLLELNHPFANWDYVLKQLRTLSIGDFYDLNSHEQGFTSIGTIIDIYFTVIRSATTEEVRENGIRYLFDFLGILLSKSNEFISRNLALLPSVIETLDQLANEQAQLFRKSSTYAKKFLKLLIDSSIPFECRQLGSFLYTVFGAAYRFWLEQPDPADWFNPDGESDSAVTEYRELIGPLAHESIVGLIERLETARSSTDEGIAAYLSLPDYFQIVNGYLLIADELERSDAYLGRQHIVKLDFLFNIINVPALADIHGTALIEINRCLSMVFREEEQTKLADFVHKLFTLLNQSASRHQYRNTIISCITTVAKEVFNLNSHGLVDAFIEELVAFGFQHPHIKGSTTEWQIKVNPAHIENIRSWLQIIAMKPRWTKRLLSALIINLKLGGVFVRDTDLLQKNISVLLNSDIAPAYNLVKQLLRVFPIYFAEIGAEGELRDISTKVDQLSFRRDNVVHFLRKQTHVESNSLLVTFLEDAFRYWATGEKDHLKAHLPEEVYDQMANDCEYFGGLNRIFGPIMKKIQHDPSRFLEWDSIRIAREIGSVKGVSQTHRERAELLIRLYQLLSKKYNPQHIDLLKDIEASFLFDSAKVRALKRYLHEKNYYKSLVVILGFLSQLKDKILSPEKTQFYENIYHKRHIAAGIPSMYGTYREEKFEAVGLSLRLESLATTLFEEMMKSLNLKFITKSTLLKIHEYLWLYVKALDLEGVATEGLTAKMKYLSNALEIKQFSVDQYLDIFQFISKGIQDIIRDYYINAFHPNLPVIIGHILEERKKTEARTPDAAKDEEVFYQMSENFIRSAISSAFGLQVLDNFINSIIGTLSAELEKFKDNKQILNLVMAYDPDLTISPLYRRNRKTDNQILIGNKGYFLKELTFFGFPIPPGFILTTEVFRGYDAVVGYKYIFEDMNLRIYEEIKRLERVAGRKFGDPKNPLLLSVRSGATISLPGMMHSFLNVGINEVIAEGLAGKKDFAWAAWDSYRRFLQTYGMFQELDRNFFDSIIETYKNKHEVTRKIQFSPDQMKQIALSYKNAMAERGIEVPSRPADQLQHAILQVFASWHSEQARIYRRQMRLSDEWGTAVIVQAMVFGNLNDQSGSGVIFTRNPKGPSQEVSLWGDFIFGVQGDDIVSGLVATYPISEKQRIEENRESPISLEKKFPEIFAELVRVSEVLVYQKRFDHQEIEFTFETPHREGLYILQTRDMVQRETKKLRIFKETDSLKRSFVGVGIGVSGGALCGRAVYSEEDIRRYREKEPRTPLILIRPDTVPDDVGVLLQVEALLTAKGGCTSHAAVTIPQLKKVGVVGFTKLRVYETKGYSTVDGRPIRGGDFIAIDGWSGSVYTGKHELEADDSYQPLGLGYSS
jgi:pyruvate, orthophosphate dikinase